MRWVSVLVVGGLGAVGARLGAALVQSVVGSLGAVSAAFL